MRVTISDIKDMKARGEKIPMITAYDYTSARIVDASGIPLILVETAWARLCWDTTPPSRSLWTK